MTLIEGIGDEVIHFFIALFFILIVTLAWWTTQITNEGSLRTVFLLERRRLRAVRRLTNHTESATIVEGTVVEDLTSQSVPAMEEDKPPESTSGVEEGPERTQVDEEARIVEAMDAPRDAQHSNDIRCRRLVFYNKHSDNKSNEPVEPCKSSDSGSSDLEDTDRICVKLMYLNDELRHVDGRLQEKLGDFKRRHFEVELAANKTIKLIFNGHVLQQETDTLQKCGLFDNCVVHCLVHQRTNSSPPIGNLTRTEGGPVPIGLNSLRNNNNQPHEWHLENYLFMVLCCFLGAAWYLRYVYAHLYTVTATIGLILMTGIFTIIMFGMHFPDNVELNQQRAENVQSHQ